MKITIELTPDEQRRAAEWVERACAALLELPALRFALYDRVEAPPADKGEPRKEQP